MAVWDRVAAAVTHRRSWAIALLIAVGAGVFIALAGPNTGADKAPLQLPPSAESARAAGVWHTIADWVIIATPGVASVSDAGSSASGLTQWKVILDTSPGSTDAFKTVAALRESVKAPDLRALVGGSDAQALDARDAAVRTVVIRRCSR